MGSKHTVQSTINCKFKKSYLSIYHQDQLCLQVALLLLFASVKLPRFFQILLKLIHLKLRLLKIKKN